MGLNLFRNKEDDNVKAATMCNNVKATKKKLDQI